MTIAFSVLLALILIIELGAGIASYSFRDQVSLLLVSGAAQWSKTSVRGGKKILRLHIIYAI